ncbi:MAG: hypothetical protein Q7U11_25485, partial [Phenylobacterium sp.]|nr:hypothetical protein [Phenylobacterium sp.]
VQATYVLNKIFELAHATSPWAAPIRALRDLMVDQRGLSTVEYSTLGGVMSGAIFLAGQALQQAQLSAIERLTGP